LKEARTDKIVGGEGDKGLEEVGPEAVEPQVSAQGISSGFGGRALGFGTLLLGFEFKSADTGCRAHV